MSRMRWTKNDPDNDWRSCLVGPIGLCVIGVVAFAIYGCHRYFSNEQLIQNTVTQDNHKEVVRLKKDVITCLKLDAKHGQEWPFKTCEDYELVTIQDADVWHSGGRGSGWWTDGVEIWMRVKQPFILNLVYFDHKNRPTFLYVKLDFKEDKQ